MVSHKHFVLLNMIVFLAMLATLGCGSQGTTTIFKWTPVNTMPDSKTSPEDLSVELKEELEQQDIKRMKKLQESVKVKAVKQKTSQGSVTGKAPEEVKDNLKENITESEAETKP